MSLRNFPDGIAISNPGAMKDEGHLSTTTTLELQLLCRPEESILDVSIFLVILYYISPQKQDANLFDFHLMRISP